MEKSKYRIKVLEKIKELEKQGRWDQDVEDDPVTIELKPNKVDYLNKKLSSKIKKFFANKAGAKFFDNMIKNNQLIIDKVVGIENFAAVKGGSIITCNHFNPCDNYAVWKTLQPEMNGRLLYKVIREGNYTNPPKPFGFFMRHCNTLPLSSNSETMKNFIKAFSILLDRGENILIYPEQAMWWNYRKPRPLKDGAFWFAVTNNKPIVPIFITMEDSEYLDGDGFPVQKYTMNILPAIYPDPNLSKKQNITAMKEKNYNMWVEVYENFYNTKLTYDK